MTRLERNRLRRQKAVRKTIWLIGTFICIFILISGVLITNTVMVRMTSLPKEKDLFYYGNIKDKLRIGAKYIVRWLKDGGLWLKTKVVYLYENILWRIHKAI
ncbi:MAG: hypothetical protein GX974_02325 [Clostridiales bacterium]|nr:hypothetical protein [Clostridiales bacterium]